MRDSHADQATFAILFKCIAGLTYHQTAVMNWIEEHERDATTSWQLPGIVSAQIAGLKSFLWKWAEQAIMMSTRACICVGHHYALKYVSPQQLHHKIACVLHIWETWQSSWCWLVMVASVLAVRIPELHMSCDITPSSTVLSFMLVAVTPYLLGIRSLCTFRQWQCFWGPK